MEFSTMTRSYLQEGMTIAYLSGRQQDSGGGPKKDYEFGYDQIKSLEARLKWGDSAFQVGSSIFFGPLFGPLFGNLLPY